jgi:hypothetical protein
MKNLDLLDLLEKSEAYADGVTVLAEGSVERAMVRAGCAGRWLIDLPAKVQITILDSAREER